MIELQKLDQVTGREVGLEKRISWRVIQGKRLWLSSLLWHWGFESRLNRNEARGNYGEDTNKN